MSRLFIRDPLFGGKQPMISPPRKGYQQDALFAANEVERQKRVLRAKVFLAANVYQQDELRGVKEVIRSFRALTKSTPRFPSSVAGGTGVVEREKAVVITALFAHHKVQ